MSTTLLRLHHQVRLRNPHQHLIRISNARRDLYMLAQGGEPVADGKKRTYRSYKVGEVMGVEPLMAGLWKQAQMLPWILHRVSTLLSALDFVDHSWADKQLTFDGVHLVVPDVVQRSMLDNHDKMMFLISDVRYKDCDTSPSPGQVVQVRVNTEF